MMNRFFTLLFAASCLTAVGQAPDYWPADGLIYWFDFESDGSSPAFDYEITTGAVNAAEDRFGLLGAAQFENDGDVLIATGDSPTPAGTFSYSFWFYTSPGSPTTTALHPVHGQTFGNEDDHSGSGVFIGSSELAIIEHSADYVREAIRVDMDLSGWHHLVVNYVNNEATIYIDGEQRGQSVSDDRLVHPPLGADTYYSSYGMGKGFGTAGYDVTVQWTGRRFVGRLDDFGVWERALLQEEIVTLFNASSPIGGCIDTMACNFNPDAEVDDGSCHFLCQYCKEGTIWDEAIQGCVVANPADINFDGCVQLNDLLDLLSAYGNCGAEESVWQCGDPLEYQGYEYETVQIGDQCWFAENLRAESYRNGSVISNDNSFFEGMTSAWNEINQLSPLIEGEEGHFYSLGVIQSGLEVCPIGWSTPSLNDWYELALETEVATGGYLLKDSVSWNGLDTYGFSAKPIGRVRYNEYQLGWDWQYECQSFLGYQDWYQGLQIALNIAYECDDDNDSEFCLAFFEEINGILDSVQESGIVDVDPLLLPVLSSNDLESVLFEGMSLGQPCGSYEEAIDLFGGFDFSYEPTGIGELAAWWMSDATYSGNGTESYGGLNGFIFLDGTTAIGGLDNQPNWGVRTNLSIRCIKDSE